jgi:UDP-N-acetylmuramyl pentapeptide phosphotransferase/UDP-N-acetylglucosamine-1-phosphate transferase
VENQTILMLLLAFAIALVGSLVACAVALLLFPWFRSGERKAGHFRPDESSGNFRVDTIKRGGKKIKVRVSSNELPLIGGWAMILAIGGGAITAGFWVGLDGDGWILLAILLAAMVGYGIVGFLDDARKVYKGVGISEIQKFVGVFIVSLGAAIAFNRFVFQGVNSILSARFAYPPYSDIPFLGHVLQHTHFAWIAFFLLMTVTIATATALAVDFSDGMDGLSGGLSLSAALAFAAVLLGSENVAYWPEILVALAMAGAVLGYLPFNWPSSWRGKGQSKAKRRAKLIMGDTGSLALGGVLALVAIISRLEFLLLIIGGVFVLEGLSALISARILVRFFRIALFHERYRSRRGFPHTELPLPFLATPMHHHYDLLGWDRKRLVYAAWLLGAGLGVLGVASAIGTFSWERYLARFVAFLILVAVWQSGAFTRNFFIGLWPTGAPKNGAGKDGALAEGELEPPRQLALYYGYPFRLFGRPLYSLRSKTTITEAALETPAERLSLWTRMNIFDARALLGFYCYRVGDLRDAIAIWEFIPRANLQVRPKVKEMFEEARNRVAMESEVDLSASPMEPAPAPSPAPGPALLSPDRPELAISYTTAGPLISRPRLEPVPDEELQPDPLPPDLAAPLWSPAGWVAATTLADPEATTEEMPALAELPRAALNGHHAAIDLSDASGLNGLHPAHLAPDSASGAFERSGPKDGSENGSQTAANEAAPDGHDPDGGVEL